MLAVVEVYRMDDALVDETFEWMWTVQGPLPFPKRRRAPDANGKPDYYEHKWDVPFYDKWAHVPGFPEFLGHPELMNPAVVRAFTPEERREHFSAGKSVATARAELYVLSFLTGSPCIRLGGKVIRLSGRGHELLSRTVERKSLPHEVAVELLVKVPPESAYGSKDIVELDSLRDYYRAVVAKVQEEAGPQAAGVLRAAFRSENRMFVYDAGILPIRRE